MSAVRAATAASSSSPSRQAGEPAASSSESAAAAPRIVAASHAAMSAPGPPCSTVSAAVTVSTRSVSTRSGWMRLARPRPTSASSSASCTTTRPWNSRACEGGRSRSRSRWARRRPSPPATRIVWRSSGTPQRSSSSIVAAIADFRASCGAPGSGKRRRLDEDRCPSATRCQAFERGPRQRKAERVPNRGRDVDNPLGRRRRPKNDVIVPGRHQDDARAGEQRNAAHGTMRSRSLARIRRASRPRFAAASPLELAVETCRRR